MKPLQILVSVLCVCELFGDAEAQAAPPICTEAGVFEIVDGTCKNYYLCVDNGQTLIQVLLSCADSFIFDPVMAICVPDSTILCQQMTTASPITTSAPLCVRYGRFPIPSEDCKRYYLCYWDGMRYNMVKLSCPNLLVFQPLLEKCVPPQTYNCTLTQGWSELYDHAAFCETAELHRCNRMQECTTMKDTSDSCSINCLPWWENE